MSFVRILQGSTEKGVGENGVKAFKGGHRGEDHRRLEERVSKFERGLSSFDGAVERSSFQFVAAFRFIP